MRALLLALSAVALVPFGACGDDGADVGNADDVAVFTEPGARFDVQTGDEFVVVLESNATTGFSWSLSAELDAAVVELVDDIYVAPGTDLVGAPGLQELTFEAVGDGSTFIQLWYVRPFDDPPEPADRAQFEVIVGTGVPSDAEGPSDGDDPASTIPDDEDAIDVGQLLADAPVGDVVVRGLLFDDGSGLFICGALAESFPPQCPGDRVEVANPDAVEADFTVAGGVRWTDRPALLFGRLVDGRFDVATG